jgi:hypothetical protein
MLKKEVPQDKEVLGEAGEICYALDEQGRYVLAESAGWEPANLANLQAWEAISEELAAIVKQIHDKKLSPLAFHMAANQMDVKLLASYMGIFSWRDRRHLKPGPFARLKPELKKRYAQVLLVSAGELEQIPSDPGPAMLRIGKIKLAATRLPA